jgi:hypothetical protein
MIKFKFKQINADATVRCHLPQTVASSLSPPHHLLRTLPRRSLCATAPAPTVVAAIRTTLMRQRYSYSHDCIHMSERFERRTTAQGLRKPGRRTCARWATRWPTPAREKLTAPWSISTEYSRPVSEFPTASVLQLSGQLHCQCHTADRMLGVVGERTLLHIQGRRRTRRSEGRRGAKPQVNRESMSTGLRRRTTGSHGHRSTNIDQLRGVSETMGVGSRLLLRS